MECEAVRQDVVHLDILGILGVIYPHSSSRYPRWIGIPFRVFNFGTISIIDYTFGDRDFVFFDIAVTR